MMADEPINLVLEHLRAMRADMTAMRDELREVKARLTAVETVLITLAGSMVRMQHTLDAHGDRLERIEKRLGLIDEPTI